MLDLGVKCLFYGPSPSESFSNGGMAYAYFFSPFGNSLRFATACKKSVVSLISKLFFLSCPAAIFWAVSFGVVNPIKAMPCAWPPPHISKEITKTYLPSVANSNASATISMVVCRIWIEAPILHVYPYPVFCGAIHSMSAMGYTVQCLFATSTTNSCFVLQVCTKYIFLFPAGTTHNPSFATCVFFDSKKPKYLPSQVLDIMVKLSHRNSSIVVTEPLLPLYRLWGKCNA